MEYCAELSEHAEEPLAGTAAHARTWLLVEENGPWAPDPIDSPGLVELLPFLRGWLDEGTEDDVRRIQLIRRPKTQQDSAPSERLFYEADVLRQTLVAWRGDLNATRVPLEDSVVLVCTHGKRDRCCALRGQPVFDALRMTEGDAQIWQTSHLGGHRFAATLLRLPDGYCLGRVNADRAEDIARAVDQGVLADRSLIRGQVAYPGPVQAADLFARGIWNEDRVSAVVVRSSEPDGDGWQVALERGDDQLTIRVGTRPLEAFGKSCGADPKPVSAFTCEQVS